MIAETIKIEVDEDGFHLIVEAEQQDGAFFRQRHFDFRLPDPETLYNEATGMIGPWLHERDRARGDFRSVYRETFGEDAPEDGIRALQENAYSPEDPKHPDHHDAVASAVDSQS